MFLTPWIVFVGILGFQSLSKHYERHCKVTLKNKEKLQKMWGALRHVYGTYLHIMDKKVIAAEALIF